MKKVLLLSMVVFVLGAGSFAFAQCMYNGNNGYGAGYGCGYGCGYDDDYGRHGHKNKRHNGYDMPMQGMPMHNMPMNEPEASVKSDKDAAALVQKYLDSNYKGYKIAKTEPFSTPRGQAYQITVNDASGNSFGFHVNPWGQVRGPFLNK